MSANEPKRIKNLRFELARQIPKFPNNRASLNALEAKSLGSLLIDYGNWAIRYVACRPRQIVVEASATSDPRWIGLQNEIAPFLAKVQRGDDLVPHLSIDPHNRGFTPDASLIGPETDRWADKDMVLNVMGYHHFHLGRTFEPKGFVTRSKNVLFANVTREKFTVVAIFDHSVFENRPNKPLNSERERLWKIFDQRATRGVSPGVVVVPSLIATSGHSLQMVCLAMNYARLVSEIDPKIDDPAYIEAATAGRGFSLPMNAKWKWQLLWLDLGLLEEKSQTFFIYRKGPN